MKKYVWVNKYDPKTGLCWMSRELVEERKVNVDEVVCKILCCVFMVGTAAVICALAAMII